MFPLKEVTSVTREDKNNELGKNSVVWIESNSV